MRHAALISAFILSACAPAQNPEAISRAAAGEIELPPMKVFAAPNPTRPTQSNRDIARDFLDLTFSLESGRKLDRFTRFEGPITVKVTGSPAPGLTRDLNRLVARLRAEARIPISVVTKGKANITIQSVPRAQIRRSLPMAACFVVPNVSSLNEYRRNRRTSRTSWTALTAREELGIFIPNDTSPQEIRDCLHEELAQALGPLNDLYRLSDSVFNDDNFHTILTGYDMMMLRAYYDPVLQNGMSRDQVAAQLPAILSRVNPNGDRLRSVGTSDTPRSWINAVQTALGPGARSGERRSAAEAALRIAKSRGWTDHRRGFSHYALGRLTQGYDADYAHAHFRAADRYYANSAASDLHRAYVAAQLAAYEISAGRGKAALATVEPYIVTAARYENAALLSTLMLLRAEALELSHQPTEASNVRLDSLGWARYGFGSDWAVQAKLREISALSPLKGRF